MTSLRRTDLLLAAGMAAGAAIAGFGLLGDGAQPRRELSSDVVAIVDGEAISRKSFDTAVGLVERDRGGAVSEPERGQILERLVDEELLLQRGLALGLPRSDRRLRGDVVATVIGAATVDAEAADPSDADLRAYFHANRSSFDSPDSLRVAQVFVASPPRADEEAAARASRIVERLRAGEDLATVRLELGDPPAVEIPSSPQPEGKLRDYVGSSAAAVARRLRSGEVSSPQRGSDGYRVLVMLDRGDEAGVVFEDRRDEVLQEYRRRAGERALDGYLRELRSQARVLLAPSDALKAR